MGDFTSEKEQKLLESEAEVSNTEDTNADELTFEETSGFSDDDDDSEEEEKKPKKKFIGYDKQNKKFFIGKFKIGKKLLIIILVIAILAGICSGLIIKSKNNSAVKVMYTDSPVERRTITNTITGSSSIKPNDSYNVTTIKSGDITSDTFKEGDVVKKGDKLYQFEDSDAQNSLSTAKNALAKAQQAYVDAVKQKAQTVSSNNIGTKSAQNAVTKALNSLNDTKNNQYIQSNSAGKVKELSVKEGDHINAGAAVATLYDDSYMKLRIPFNEVDAESIQTGAVATVSVIGSGDTIYGTVKEKSSSAVSTDAHAKVVYVTVEVTNPGALTTNDYGSAEINGVACANTAQFEYVSEGTITSTASGTLENLNIAVGDSVYSGQKVGYVKYDNQNSTMSNAQLSYNDAVLALEKQVLQNDTFSQDSSIKNAQLALDDAELGIEKAQDAVDDYVVEAPIEGTVVKKNSKAAIQGLKEAGVKKTVMLTGDAKKVADSVAAELGVDEVHSELLPADKVEKIEELLAMKGAKEKLAFVGDGINDAPVLSRADIGIAMGAMGSDAAIEAADIVLMDYDPAKIALAMKISRKTLRIVYENIVFALAVKFVCLVLGALGIANMWIAIFADVGVMVIAVLNATRALRTGNL